jgi:RNA-directed DNA polymerase
MQSLHKMLNTTVDEIYYVVNNIKKYYVSYPIKKKSGGLRWINVPQEPLKTWQRIILKQFLEKFQAHSIAHGFVKNKSPLTNANKHVNKKLLITLDIKDFFKSISRSQVMACLEFISTRLNFNYNFFDVICMACLLTLDNSLPQGAPTSPMLANLVCVRVDSKLSKQYSDVATITRYADDIAISFDEEHYKTASVYEIITTIKNVYRFILGLEINKRKIRIQRPSRRMLVTGVVVNKKINIIKSVYKNLRAELHQLVKNNTTITFEYKQQLQGKIAWVRSLNPNKGQKLFSKLQEINASKV